MVEQKTSLPASATAPEERVAQPSKKKSAAAQKIAEAKEKITLTRDKVTVFATLDEEVKKAIDAVATERGHILVRLEEKVIDDFIAAKNAPTPEQAEVDQVKQFVADENNRSNAEDKAKALYSYLTKKPIEEFEGQRFTRKDIVKHTNLSNSTALALLTTLETFGYIRYTGGKMEEFVFEFRPAEIHRLVRRQVTAMMTEVVKDFARYRVLIEQDKTLNKKARDREIAAPRAVMRSQLA